MVLGTALDPNDASSWVGGASALTLLTVAIGFNATTMFRLRREVKVEKDARRQDQRVCNYQLSIMSKVLEDHNIPMPPNFWDIPEEPVLVKSEQETRRKAWMFKFGEDEAGWVTSIFFGTVVAILAVFALFALALNSLVLDPVKDLQVSRKQDACIASLSADQFYTIILQLNAPPNSQQRSDFGNLGIRAADRIRRRNTICADGKPDDFPLPSVLLGPS
jgi:hypothetical protein